MPVGDLNTVEIVFISLAVVALSVGAAAYLFFTRHKKSADSQRYDFIFRFAVVWGLFTAILVVLWLVGFLDENTTKLLIGVVSVGVAFAYWRAWRGVQIPTIDAIRKKYAFVSIREKWPDCRNPSGGSNQDALIWEKRVPDPIPGDPFRVVDIFLVCQESFHRYVFILLKFDPQKLTSTFAMINPGQEIVYDQLTRSDAESAWTALQQYQQRSEEAGVAVA